MMRNTGGKKFHLSDAYGFEGFRSQTGKVRGVFGKPRAQILPLERCSMKTCCGECGTVQNCWYDSEVKQVLDLPCGGKQQYLEIEIRRVLCQECGKLTNERLEWLADNHLYTKRFEMYVAQRCREAAPESVANELGLDRNMVDEIKKFLRTSGKGR